jgi:hypothetical protein
MNAYAIDMDYAVGHVRSAGIMSRVDIGSADVWADGAYTDGRLYASEDPYAEFGTKTWQMTEAAKTVSWTVGCRMRVIDRFLDVSAEWRNTLFPGTSDPIDQRFLQRAVYGAVDIALSPVRSTINASCLYSLRDGSFLLASSFEICLRDIHTLRFGCSVPVGSQDEDLGQYAAGNSVFLTFSVRF